MEVHRLLDSPSDGSRLQVQVRNANPSGLHCGYRFLR